MLKIRAVVRRCSAKTVFSKILQNSQENTCVGVSLLKKLHHGGFVKKDTPAQVFPCEF